MRCRNKQMYAPLLLSMLLGIGAFIPVNAQTAVSASQPAAAAPAGSAPSTSLAPAATNAAPAAATPPAPANDMVSKVELPRAEQIHRTLYAIYEKQDNHELAAAELDELIRMKPTDAVFPFAYGSLLMKDSKWTEAIARFEASTKIDPTFSNAFCGIGDCDMKLKEYTKAIDAYTLANRNAKAGQSYTAKVAIARQWQERKQQEDDYNKALQKLNGPKAGGTKSGVKKK